MMAVFIPEVNKHKPTVLLLFLKRQFDRTPLMFSLKKRLPAPWTGWGRNSSSLFVKLLRRARARMPLRNA